MLDLKIGITHADSLAAEALLKALADIDIEKEAITLFSVGDNVGHRLPYGSSYLVTSDQTEDSFSGCGLVMQLEEDAELSEKIISDGSLLLKQGGTLFIPDNEDEYCNIDFSQNVFDLVNTESYLILKMLRGIHLNYDIQSAQITIIQPASNYGKSGVEELASQTVELLNARPVEPNIFPVQQAFNVYAKTNGLNQSEICQQIQLNLDESTSLIQIQEIQAPVFYGMTLAFTVQCEAPLTETSLEYHFSGLKSVKYEADKDAVISPVTSLQEDDLAQVSQLKVVENNPNSFQFVLTAEQHRHGLAELFLNALLVIRKTFL